MKKRNAPLAAFASGGLLYGLCELVWRGWTHWSMPLAGGLSLMLLYFATGLRRAARWQKWLMGMCIITTVEFLFGCVVNLRLGWNVWDYSRHRGNLLGQICPLFCVAWLGLSVPAVWLCNRLRRWERGDA